MALKDALAALNNAVKDLTSLHVQTFTGTLTSTISSDQGFDDIEKAVKDSQANGTIKLVAEALVKFDGDSYNFVTDDIDHVPPLAIEIHKKAVDSGLQNRQALLALFKGLITG